MVFALTKTLSPCFIRINEVFYFFGGGSRFADADFKFIRSSQFLQPQRWMTEIF